MFALVQGPIAVDDEKQDTFGLAGEPLVVTVPLVSWLVSATVPADAGSVMLFAPTVTLDGNFIVALLKSCSPVVYVLACPAPTSEPVGAVRLVPHALPVDTAIPAPG